MSERYPDARQLARHPAVSVRDRLGGGHSASSPAFVLSSVYRDATERAFDRRLNLYLRTLVAEVATPDEPPDHQFQSLGEPLFELPLSGWYWQITRTDTDKAETRARARYGTRSCRSSRIAAAI